MPLTTTTRQKHWPEIGLLGASLETHNNGVSALTASLATLFLSFFPSARITLLIGSRTAEPQKLAIRGGPVSLRVVNYRLSISAKKSEHLLWILLLALAYRLSPSQALRTRIITGNHWLSTVMESDFIGDIWAGDSFSDIYGTLRLLIGALPKLVIYLLGRKVVFLPQTYGPFRSFLGRRLAWLLLRHADLIMIRDRLSIPVIRRVSGRYFDPQKLRFCPDVAFIMGSTDGVRSELEQELTGRQVDRVGLNISGLLYLKSGSGGKRFSLRFDYRRFVRILMEGLLGEDRTEIILVPHTYTIDPNDRGENDYAASLEALSQLPVEARAKVHLIRRECDQFEIKGAIGACDFFIGSRLHACIAAISQGIPTIGVAYSWKFSGIFASVGMSVQTIDIRQVGLRETVDRILDMYRHRSMLRRDISSRAAEIPLMIQREFAKLLETHLAATRQA